MFTHIESDTGVSNVVGVILVVAITIILAALVLWLVLGFSPDTQSSTSLSSTTATTITSVDGTVTVTLMSGNPDEIAILVDNEEQTSKIQPSPGDRITVENVEKGSTVTVVGSKDDTTFSTGSKTIQNGPTYIDAPSCDNYTWNDQNNNNVLDVNSLTDLQCINANSTTLSDEYELTSNIDATSTITWNNNNGFDPIGNATDRFRGTIDGNNHTISNLYINRPTTSHVGLIGRSRFPTSINNLGIINAEITGDSRVGILSGTNVASITNSYVTGSVSGTSRVGGLVGYSNQATITESYSTATVNGGDNVGGLVGFNYGTVDSSYSTGSVSGTGRNVGGLIGNSPTGTVESSYSTGSVSGTENPVGGLIGNSGNYTSVQSSYWDFESSGQDSSSEEGSGSNGLTTSEMTGSNAESNMSGFDFASTWSSGASDEYPALVWESE